MGLGGLEGLQVRQTCLGAGARVLLIHGLGLGFRVEGFGFRVEGCLNKRLLVIRWIFLSDGLYV